ncbi:hypothetical protein GCM10010909_23840 [Acidocella aquatica]|uniref:DUF3576 domain-containing protein n=1 Tax=Acidocella aquatica TaxID=1922313 RepID=A0ABQ6A7T8_9PROT|nr:hypothetical protein GCM10010909_23840 [Acidocella aquatica]
MFKKIAGPAVLLLGAMALTGCGKNPPSIAAVNNPETSSLPGAMASTDSSSSGTLFTFGKGSSSSTAQATQIQVNAYLWRATLNTLAFMPLVSADPFGGVIITDWYTPPATPGERFKVNAYILGRELTADAIQVSVFHQTQENGQWVDTPADPATAGGLEDRILANAANLQAAAQHTN